MMTKPCAELKTAKRAWKRTERRSVMARTADIQVSASRGSTTQELQREALETQRRVRQGDAGERGELSQACTEPGALTLPGTDRAPHPKALGMSHSRDGLRSWGLINRTETESMNCGAGGRDPERWEGQTHRHDGTEPQPEAAASGDRGREGRTERWERRRRETSL